MGPECSILGGSAATGGYLLQRAHPPRVKPLLYVYRVLLTGIHLMRTGVVEANLVTLNREFRLPYIAELVDRKVRGREKSLLNTGENDFHKAEYTRLIAMLEDEAAKSNLPNEPTARDLLNDLLVRLRLKTA